MFGAKQIFQNFWSFYFIYAKVKTPRNPQLFDKTQSTYLSRFPEETEFQISE
jgi:hypothetical protein